MKKTYSKPEILFENFALTTNIAGDCEHITSLPSAEASCGYPTRGGVVFTSTPNCEVTSGTAFDAINNSICYHVPVDTNNLFNS